MIHTLGIAAGGILAGLMFVAVTSGVPWVWRFTGLVFVGLFMYAMK